jgi:hypothetical protein
VIIQDVGQLSFNFFDGRPVEIEISDARLTTDAGLLPIREFDERLRFTEQFAEALQDLRQRDGVKHSLASMVRQRIYGALADYEDQNDHDTLRDDPVFQMICGRTPGDHGCALASQPTLSRFENAVSISDLWRLRDVFVDHFIQSFETPPARITLDIDAFDDPAHGQQQLTFFHGHYDQNQYLPIAITCAENDMTILVGLRHGTCAAFLGVDDDLRYLAKRLRAVWPGVEIVVRGDSGFGVPIMYDVCRELCLTFTFGIGVNPVLKRKSKELMERAVAQYEQTKEPQRLFMSLMYQAQSWPAAQRVVIKCEANDQGTNCRAVVTNRAGAEVLIQPVYDEYTERGESENRNKEIKRGVCGDRLSDHRFMANYFRLFLYAATLNLLVLLRRHVALPLTPRDLSESGDLPQNLPAEAFAGADRKRFFNRRRARDPLGEGHTETWRTRLIKVAAEVLVRARRIIIRLSSNWPHLDTFNAVSRRVLDLAPK